MDPTLPTPTGQTSRRGSNHMSAAEITTQINPNHHGTLGGVESIDPNTGEKEVMEEQVDSDELEAGSGLQIMRNDVDIINYNE
ncbi:hypothetical protein R1sor_012009 [Riccia sorocarpa]|uniref:Uncharacterized protein n=1 Tax=Riccia sorocarpa TaxID=122646 RepID=A0ABD3I2K5_9MARC